MAEAAKQFTETILALDRLSQGRPKVLVIPELEEDRLTRYEAAGFIGRISLPSIVEHPNPLEQKEADEFDSLHDAIKEAKKGNSAAYNMIWANVSSITTEMTLKVGHVTPKIMLSQNERGEVVQHGQSLRSVHANSLLYASETPEIRERSEPEARNGFRLEKALRLGRMQEYNFVVISRAANNMSQADMKRAGFLDETMTCVIQVTSLDDDTLTIENGFVAGVAAAEEVPHDEETICKLAAQLGLDFSGKSPTEILDTPLLIHKSLMPNGVLDLIALYDYCAGGTFFGESRQRQDYLEYAEVCRQREESYIPRVRQIVAQLLSEADTINDPVTAVKRLHKLAEAHMVAQAVIDKTINPAVFGPAATYIEQARVHVDLGNTELALAATHKAQAVARSTSCPTALRESLEGANGEGDTGSTETASSDKSGKIKCIKCREVVEKAEVVTEKSWRCPSCKYEVDICNGKEIHSSEPPRPKSRSQRVISLLARQQIKEEHPKRQQLPQVMRAVA